ncbi:MAG: hypothetical protein JNJ55_06370 [Betaproteobacteria bacterium]|nr:hypothetical protein [Betaproteobacteria bacterium]
MTRNAKIIVGLAVLAVIAAFGYWVYSNLDWEETTVPVPVRGPARTNNLLAAERLSARLGSVSESTFGIQGALRLIGSHVAGSSANPANSVLFLPTARRTLIARHEAALRDWVRAGGHLIAVTYTLEGESDRPDTLLAEFGFKQTRTKLGEKSKPKPLKDEDEEESAQEAEERRQREAARKAEELLKKLPGFRKREEKCWTVRESGALAPRFPQGRETLSACFDPRFHLEGKREALWAVTSEHGVHALTQSYGQGKVTVLTDYFLFQNESLGKADHADLFAAMVGFNDAGKKPTHVYLMPREEYDGIFTLTWRYAWPVVLTLALLTMLALWRWGARFGPVHSARTHARRSLAEHVRASGEFLFRHGQSTTLWRATLDAARRRAERVLPRATFQNEDAYLDALATRSGIDAQHLRLVFLAPHPPSSEQFAHSIATLNQLRNAL